jgi:hypothetical protein
LEQISALPHLGCWLHYDRNLCFHYTRCCDGNWVFDRKKGQDYGEKIDAKENRKVTIKLSNEQKDQLMAFQDKEIVEESGYDQDGFVSLTY